MRINLGEEQFAQIGRLLFIDDGHVNVKGLTADAQTKEDHLNCGQEKLKEKETEPKKNVKNLNKPKFHTQNSRYITPKSGKVFPRKNGRRSPVISPSVSTSAGVPVVAFTSSTLVMVCLKVTSPALVPSIRPINIAVLTLDET